MASGTTGWRSPGRGSAPAVAAQADIQAVIAADKTAHQDKLALEVVVVVAQVIHKATAILDLRHQKVDLAVQVDRVLL